jgi:hypothetical protein
MKTKRSRPEGRLIANASLDFEGQGDVTGDKIVKQVWAAGADSSMVYRRSATAPQAKTAIAKPKRKESNARLGATYGNRVCLGFTFDEDRYAIQTRSPEIAKQIKRWKGVVLFADALVGQWMQTLLVPCKSEAQGRRIVDELLQSGKAGSDCALTIHGEQCSGSKLPQNYTVAEKDGAPNASGDGKTAGEAPADHPDWDWDWIEERKPEAVGVEFCIAFPRFDGQWAVQIKDPRLVPCFSKRARTRLSGYSVGGWGNLRQYMVPCKSKVWARKIVLTALSTLPEYERQKHKLKGAMK